MTTSTPASATPDSGNAQFYDADSTTYDETRWVTAAGRRADAVERGLVSSLTDDWARSSVLEVGSGTGRFSKVLLDHGCRLTLVDVSTAMLRTAAENIADAGLSDGVEGFIEGSVYELPLPSASFDHALMINVLNHIAEPDRAISELSRVIRPGGSLVCTYANLRSYFFVGGLLVNRRRQAIGQEVYSRWEMPSRIKRTFEDAGFVLADVAGHVHMPRRLDGLPIRRVLDALDVASRSGPLAAVAPIHYCTLVRTG